jgi:hypothetical protein
MLEEEEFILVSGAANVNGRWSRLREWKTDGKWDRIGITEGTEWLFLRTGEDEGAKRGRDVLGEGVSGKLSNSCVFHPS